MTEETDPVAGANQTEIIELLTQHGPLTRDELLDKAKNIEDGKALSNALYLLVHTKRQVVKRADGNYALAGDDSTPPPARKIAERIVATRRGRRGRDEGGPTAEPVVNATGNGKLGAILEKAVEDAQAALDDYLCSLADPEIVTPLREMRDQARRALDHYRKTHGA